MEANLKINANCQLVATPINFELENILNPCSFDSNAIVFLEFLINPDADNNKTIKISKNYDDYYYCDLPSDGLYVYHKLKIFDKAFVDENYMGLCYDSKHNKLIFKGVELKDIFEILPYLDKSDYGVLEYIKSPIFSICKLQNCLKELQKKSITQCRGGLCDNFESDRKLRDFLFISIYVLENLIDQERFGEASDILKSLSSCAPICKNISLNKSGCNCK